MENELILFLVFLMMNIIGFYLIRVDKLRAKKHQYRISERTLWTFALFGGAIGSTIGMQVYRHKTKHTSFKFGFPSLAIVQVFLFSYFF